MGAIEPKKPTVKGPAEWFTGDVWIDSLGRAQRRLDAATWARCTSRRAPEPPGTPTTEDRLWCVTEGHGLVQSRGEDVIELHAGDVHRTAHGGALARIWARPLHGPSVDNAGACHLGRSRDRRRVRHVELTSVLLA